MGNLVRHLSTSEHDAPILRDTRMGALSARTTAVLLGYLFAIGKEYGLPMPNSDLPVVRLEHGPVRLP